MASQLPPQPSPSSDPGWRPVTPPALAQSSSPASWRNPESPKAVVPSRVRVARLAGVLLLILLVATALVWFILWLRPPGPAVLLLVAAGYEDNLAVDAYPQGREGMSRLASVAGTSSPLSRIFRRSGRLRLARQPSEFRLGRDWSLGLDTPAEKTVIIYLGLQGGADYQGAYLLPQDASADPADRLRLDSVLDRIA